MARKSNFDKVKNTLFPVISGVAFVLLLWALLYGKVKASNLLEPIVNRLPKNDADLVTSTDNVLGAAVKKIKEGTIAKQAAQQGSQFFEESKYAAPARDMRDDLKIKIDDAVSSAKELPSKELKHVQREVCRQWLGDEIFIATESASESADEN